MKKINWEDVLKRVKEETGKDIWLWSGYIYENITGEALKRELLKNNVYYSNINYCCWCNFYF